MKVFEQAIKVKPEDLDDLDHVNNVVYVQWIQDVAKTHWQSMAPLDVQSKYIWMVLRHEIDYSSQAVKDDELIARTWVQWSEGVRSERHVEIRNPATNKVVAKAKTLWVLLDAITKRPRKIERDITDVFN